MARKLGYMWYPKDWSYSDSVFELRIHERGVYRELIDMAMMQDNIVIIKKITWCRKWYIKVDELDSILDHLSSLNLVIIDGDKLSVPSCETRLYAKRNGSKGGKSTADGTANSTADDTPKVNINKNIKKINILYPFENFWNTYNKKQGGKHKVKKKWDGLKDLERDAIMNHLQGYVPATAKDKAKFRHLPMTYLNGRMWEDEGLPDNYEDKKVYKPKIAL